MKGDAPFITQSTTQGRRPITEVAKVKGVFMKTGPSVEKVSQAFVKKDNTGPTGTTEKIHQSVPTGQFSD